MRNPFATSATYLEARRLILVKVEGAGEFGWGEAAPVPGHSSETLDQVWDSLEEAAADVIAGSGDRPPGPAGAAWAQAEIDLAARLAAVPLRDHLGGSEEVWASAAIGLAPDGTPDRRAVEHAAAAGYRHAKLKISENTDPAILAGVLEDFPAVTFGADANESLASVPRTHLEAIDNLGFSYLEQPGPSSALAWHRSLCDLLATPISLDESASTVDAVRRITADASADIVNLKVGRFGTAQSLELARMAASGGLGARLGGLIESGIGRSHAVALAGCREFSVVGDIAASDLYFDDDLVSPHWRLVEGRLESPVRPGIGVEVDEAAIAARAFWSLVAE